MTKDFTSMPAIVLATLNARYQHCAFGLRYLLANLGELQSAAVLREFTIQQPPVEIVETLLRDEPRIVGFGVYIWNVEQTTEVVTLLKRLRPELIVVLGGPEVSYESTEQPICHASDYVISGEADFAFAELCRQLLSIESRLPPVPLPPSAGERVRGSALPVLETSEVSEDFGSLHGLKSGFSESRASRSAEDRVEELWLQTGACCPLTPPNPPLAGGAKESPLRHTAVSTKFIAAPLADLSRVALPYDLYTDEDLQHRVIYVEASRGCPYECEFCLSALDIPVRQFALEPFLAAMQRLLERGARVFKFVDRTFNLNLRTSRAILEFFLARYTPGLFLHFEMIPDRLPDALREIIAQFPAGSLQFEVGIQTFSPEVATRISRRQDNELVDRNLRWLRDHTGVHVHADLIFGLPGETLESFAGGFDRLVALRPHEIQVGHLKRLRGTPIIRHDAEFQMVYSPHPPYELLQNSAIDFATMQALRRFAKAWDLIANSGNFVETTPLFWTSMPHFGRSNCSEGEANCTAETFEVSDDFRSLHGSKPGFSESRASQSAEGLTEQPSLRTTACCPHPPPYPPLGRGAKTGSPFAAFWEFSAWLSNETGRTHGIALPRLLELVFRYLTEHQGWPPEAVAPVIYRDYLRGGRSDVPACLRSDLKPAGSDLPSRGERPAAMSRQRRHAAS
jgi:radical SAM superfamily enzyme YgiQ (UPF0313 family)